MLAMYFPENAGFQYWQTITHMFMHGGYMHIFSICFVLFGSALESIWGSKKFLFLYILWFRQHYHTRNKLLLFQ
jgi:membrane associated rhomboid family serine protease